MAITRTRTVNSAGPNTTFVAYLSGAAVGTLTLNPTDLYCVINISGAAPTINLPPSPYPGETHHIRDAGGTAGAESIPIQGNGNTINGAGTSVSLSVSYASMTLVWNVGRGCWDYSQASRAISLATTDVTGILPASKVEGVGGNISAVAPVSATHFDYTGNTKGQIHTDEAQLQTTDATVTSLLTWTLRDICSTQVDVVVHAVLADGTSNVYRASAKYSRNTATYGVTQSTQVNTNSAIDDGTLGGVTLDFTGTTARVRVTGKALTNVRWYGVIVRTECVP